MSFGPIQLLQRGLLSMIIPLMMIDKSLSFSGKNQSTLCCRKRVSKLSSEPIKSNSLVINSMHGMGLRNFLLLLQSSQHQIIVQVTTRQQSSSLKEKRWTSEHLQLERINLLFYMTAKMLFPFSRRIYRVMSLIAFTTSSESPMVLTQRLYQMLLH